MKYCDKCRSSYPVEFNVCPIDNSVLRLTSILLPGMTIRDKYVILDKLGEGGMGVVYRARHLAFGEILAIKVVHSTLAENPAFLKRFKTEAIVARKLNHPNAVRIEDLDSTEDGRPFIVMEFVAGSDLRSVIAGKGSLPVKRAVGIAIQVADALSAAHQLGIVHRDIKPDNILLARGPADTEIVKVADFGIAKVLEGTLDVGTGYASTKSGIIVGTPQYLSPEQAMGNQGSNIDGRADLYSLGIVLYMMLTGQLPFESDTPMGFLVHHLQTVPTPPDLLRPDLRLPPALSRALMKSLEKDRERRFADADEMKRALQNVLEEPEPVKERSAKARPVPPHVPAQVRSEASGPKPVTVPVNNAAPRQSRFVFFSIGAVLLLVIASSGAYILHRYWGRIGGNGPANPLISEGSIHLQPNALVTVVTTPGGATLSADGRYQYSSNGADGRLQLSLPPGNHSLRVSLDGFKDWEKTVTLDSGGSAQFTLTLERTSPPAEPHAQRQNPVSRKTPQFGQGSLPIPAQGPKTVVGQVTSASSAAPAPSLGDQPVEPPPQKLPEMTAQEHLVRADEFAKRKQWTAATAEFRAALQLQPNNAMAHNNFGVLLEMSGAGERAALEEYQKACALDPRNAAAKANYERVRQDLGR